MKEPKLVLIHKKHGYFLPKEESIVGTYNVVDYYSVRIQRN